MTQPVRVLVAEDEELAREKLRRFIEAESDLELVGEATDGPTALEALATLRPDLLFLDVQMPGLTGIDVLRRAARPRYVIFTTAFDHYALAAFEFEAVDYLLKPFGPARFRSAVERVRRRRSPAEVGEGVEHLTVVERGRVRTVPLDAIVRFEARDDYVAAWTSGARYLLSTRMQALEERLDPHRFVRVHRSHIVNVRKVQEFVRLGGGRLRVVMEDGSTVDTSRAGGRRLRMALRVRG